MARIFISFAIEDKNLRTLLVGQKKNARTAIEFSDFSVKEPWSSQWKSNCRTRIKGCAGMIGIITRNTPKADGQLWELKCAKDEGIPTLLIHGHSATEKKIVKIPTEISGKMINIWGEQNIVNFLNKFN